MPIRPQTTRQARATSLAATTAFTLPGVPLIRAGQGTDERQRRGKSHRAQVGE